MNSNQLEIGKQLTAALEKLRTQKGVWEKSSSICELQIRSDNDRYYATSEHVNFDVLKTLTLDTINKKISELQKEFDSL